MTYLPSPTSSFERRWILWAAVIGMLITMVPYLIGYQMQGQDWRFTGFIFGVNDGNSYIFKMRSGAEGSWLFRTPYTSVEQKGILAFVPYLLLGKLTSSPGQHEQLVALFHLYRFFGGVLVILATYEFIAYFVERVPLRRLGTLLACFGGGLGWLLVLIGQGNWFGSLPLDFYSPETFGFLSLYGLPHLAVARALLLWGLLFYLRGNTYYPLPNIKIDSGIVAGLFWLIMGFFQPLTIAVAWAVMGAHLVGYGLSLVWQGRRHPPAGRLYSTAFQPWRTYLRQAIVAGLISLPFVLYSFLALRGDPFLRAWTAQNKILSPTPWHYLVAYILVFPYAVVGTKRLLRIEPIHGWFLIGWVILLPVLAYAPFNLQRRLPEGIWVAFATLTVAAIDQSLKPSRAWSLPLTLAFPTTILLIVGGITSTMNPQPPIFRPTAEVDAFLFIDGKAQTGDVVLSAFGTGNALPAWAPVRVVIGHGPESVGLAELQPQVETFFQSGTSDIERQQLLDDQQVAFVFWGPDEQLLGNWDPHQASYLAKIYQKGGYSIFEYSP